MILMKFPHLHSKDIMECVGIQIFNWLPWLVCFVGTFQCFFHKLHDMTAITPNSMMALNQSNSSVVKPQRAKFMGPTWGPPGSCPPQMGPMLSLWTLLSRTLQCMTDWSLMRLYCDLMVVTAAFKTWCSSRSFKGRLSLSTEEICHFKCNVKVMKCMLI